MWACQHDGVDPDVMCIGKGLASGLPLAGIVARAEVMDWEPGGHGSTFGGNPVACAAALAALGVLEREIASGRPNALGEKVGAVLRGLADRHAAIGEVRGAGTMLAFELVKDRASREPAPEAARAILAAARDRGLLLLSAGTYANVIRLLFPITIEAAALDEGLAILEAAVAAAL
jgi:4-aminobutyrate aminotransferase/4-aminobutyrate aminotransferase/(S)-3-amino-2-methylpropionate transaminase